MKSLDNFGTIALGAVFAHILGDITGFEKTALILLGGILGQLSIVISRTK